MASYTELGATHAMRWTGLARGLHLWVRLTALAAATGFASSPGAAAVPVSLDRLQGSEHWVQVSEPPPTQAGGGNEPQVPPQDVLLEVSADTDAPYVQARVRYRVRVLARVPLRNATLSEPTADGALIRRIGGDRRFNVQENGGRYRVSERVYVVVADRAGPLTIGGPTLSAAVPVRALQSGAADALIERRTVIHRSAPDLVVEVRPPPAAAASPWLPAESVSISEHWQPEPEQARIGAPLQRRIVIEAAGVGTSAMPPPDMPPVPGLRVYPEPAEHRQQEIGDDLSLTTTLTQTIVPTLPGVLTLPEVSVPWWSLGMNEARAASLPARPLVVVAEGLEPAAAGPTEADVGAGWRQRFLERAGADFWGAPGLALVLALGWLGTLVLWLRERRRRPAAAEAPPGNAAAAVVSAAAWVRRFRRACEKDDPTAARAALAGWAAGQRGHGGACRGLSAALHARGAGEEAHALVRELDEAVYGHHGTAAGPWRGRALMTVLLPLMARAEDTDREAAAPGLPPLFPAPLAAREDRRR